MKEILQPRIWEKRVPGYLFKSDEEVFKKKEEIEMETGGDVVIETDKEKEEVVFKVSRFIK